MTKEIPLSLQVFHSRNEYEAQRLNRTEQIRLRDLHDVLRREEKLYVKDQALFRQRFQSHYLRGRYDHGFSNGSIVTNTNFQNARTSASRNYTRPASVSSRVSVFSAPGKLQTNRPSSVDNSLASKMRNSFGGITTLTRFQRVQRKFSLASFTENGLLTKNGSKMSKDIDKAREILFKRNNSRSEFSKANKVNRPDPLSHRKDIQQDKMAAITGERLDDNVGNGPLYRDNTGSERQTNVLASETLEKDQPDDTNMGRRVSLGPIVEESQNPRSRVQTEPTCSTDTTERSVNRAHNNAKKKVTILSNGNGDESDKDRNEALDDDINGTTKDFSEWKPIFSKTFKRADPLQQRINGFLADQKDFNKVFPKRFDGVTMTSTLQTELASIGKEKKEQESRDRKKKNEIVLEVLNNLGIEDEQILGLYQDNI